MFRDVSRVWRQTNKIGTSVGCEERYIQAQKSVPLEKIQKYFISASRMAQAYLVDGVTGDNVQEVYKALKKRQKSHRGAVELDPEPKIRRPLNKASLQPQIPEVPSSRDPIIINLEDLDLEDVGSDTSDSEMERDSEDSADSDSDIIVEE